LVSAENPTSPSCTKTYTATSPNSNVTIITGEPAATISVSGTNPICTNSTSVIRFTGNGGATVHYSKNGVGDFIALIDATTGFVDVTTGVLFELTYYDLLSIVVSGANPCIKNYPSGSAKVTVVVIPSPTITVQPQPTTVSEGAADVVLSIIATGESLSYQWNDGTNNVGTNSNILNVPATSANNGKCYTCTVTDSCGVFVTSLSACVTISTLGIKNETAKLGIQLNPNPSKGIFYLKSPFDLQVQVYNGLGQFVFSQEIFTGVNVLDLSVNGSGIYFVRAIEASNVNTYKIIKN
jgi:hypothetical protein